MSLFLPKLSSKEEVDGAIKGVAEKVLVLRFGRDEDSSCLQLDEIVRMMIMMHNLLLINTTCKSVEIIYCLVIHQELTGVPPPPQTLYRKLIFTSQSWVRQQRDRSLRSRSGLDSRETGH
jgi:hypothetical protein